MVADVGRMLGMAVLAAAVVDDVLLVAVVAGRLRTAARTAARIVGLHMRRKLVVAAGTKRRTGAVMVGRCQQ